MTEHKEHRPPTRTICTNCLHVERPESFCQRFRRRLQQRPRAVLECTGFVPVTVARDRVERGEVKA